VKADKADNENKNFQVRVIKIPGHLIEIHQQPENTTDQGAVKQVENPVDKRAALPQIPGKKR